MHSQDISRAKKTEHSPRESIPSIVRRFTRESPEWRRRRKEIQELIKNIRSAERIGSEENTSYQPPRELLESFYREAQTEFRRIPLTKEQIETYLTSERLSHLSLADYKELLRRLPPRYMTHVTRQGIRDHTSGALSHDTGWNAAHHGFEEILQTGVLRSVLEQQLLETISLTSVETVLRNLGIPSDAFPTRTSAEERIFHFLHSNKYAGSNLVPSEIADRRSLHLAMDLVADTFYGGEQENEIFFVFPTAYIASQCVMGSQIWDFPPKLDASKKGDASKNDFWILLKQRGAGQIPIDAGLTFLPKETPVNPHTGSKYATNAKGEPLGNDRQLEALHAFASREDGIQTLRRLLTIRSKCSEFKRDIQDKERRGMTHEALDQALQSLETERNSILNDLEGAGVTDPRLRQFALKEGYFAYQELFHLIRWIEVRQRPTALEEEIEQTFQRNPLRFQLAEHPIPSQVYWERYFQEHGVRPSKIVWYDASQSPTEAVQGFFTSLRSSASAEPADVDLKTAFEENLIGSHGIHEQLRGERELIWKYACELLERWYPPSDHH